MQTADTGPTSLSEEVHVLKLGDRLYPPLLKLIHDPPERLFAMGDPSLLAFPQIALVGSRRASPAGLRVARELAASIAASGLGVCSGMAQGIDGASHRGALDVQGATVAVLGTGVDRVYPKRHRELAGEIRQFGCLVSEFPPGTPPCRHNFPRRNRIISGLSLGVVVIEAAPASGSLITARQALEQGREVFALPWSMLHQGGMGCLGLLQDGAKLVRHVDDILEELGPLLMVLRNHLPGPSQRQLGAPPLLAMVGFEATHLDDILAASGLPLHQVSAQLTALELDGLIQQCPGGYIRC